MSTKIKLPPSTIVEKWSQEKVIKWLKKVKLDDCIPIFESRQIDGAKLLELTEQKLFTYQDMKIKHRGQIAKCVTECKTQAAHAKRIVGNIKHHRSKRKTSDASAANGEWESDEDFDYWDSDFDEDFDEEPEATSSQISESSCSTTQTDKTDSSISPVKEEHLNACQRENEQQSTSNHSDQTKPPIVPPLSNSNSQAQALPLRSTIPRPPIKRPPSGPPPPPVPRPPSQETVEAEEYEVPISHPVEVIPLPVKSSRMNVAQESNSYKSPLGYSASVANGIENTETYEVIESNEENYEVVQGPPVPVKPPEKPNLPPRLQQTSINIPPPPLPLKPKKLQESMSGLSLGEGSRSLSRPTKLSISNKQDEDSGHDTSNHSTGIIGSGILGSFLGRRNSNSSSLPRSNAKNRNSGESIFSVGSTSDGQSCGTNPERDGFFTVGSSAFISCTVNMSSTEAQKIQSTKSDESVQNFATRPLPPVPLTESRSSPSKQSSVTSFPWFHEIEREDAELEIQNLDSSGAFLVRPSKRAGKENPYTLTVLHNGKVFHLNIRLRPDDTYALGKEKRKEMTFQTVPDLISHHQREPILLTSRGEIAGQTILGAYPEK